MAFGVDADKLAEYEGLELMVGQVLVCMIGKKRCRGFTIRYPRRRFTLRPKKGYRVPDFFDPVFNCSKHEKVNATI